MSALAATTALAAAGLAPGSAAWAAAEGRARVLEMTAAAEAAVLAPAEPGAWPHPLRAALAARIVRIGGDGRLAARYAAGAGGDPASALADPARDGAEAGLGAVLAFVDRVARTPREVTAADVLALRQAGIADADIVRLAELNAFVAYQLRLVAGLRLLAGEEAGA